MKKYSYYKFIFDAKHPNHVLLLIQSSNDEYVQGRGLCIFHDILWSYGISITEDDRVYENDDWGDQHIDLHDCLIYDYLIEIYFKLEYNVVALKLLGYDEPIEH